MTTSGRLTASDTGADERDRRQAIDAIAATFNGMIDGMTPREASSVLSAALRAADHGRREPGFYDSQVAGYLFTATGGRIDLTSADSPVASCGQTAACGRDGVDAAPGYDVDASEAVRSLDAVGDKTDYGQADGAVGGKTTVRATYSPTYSIIDATVSTPLRIREGELGAKLTSQGPSARFDSVVLPVSTGDGGDGDRSPSGTSFPKSAAGVADCAVEEAYFYYENELVALSEQVPVPAATAGKFLSMLTGGADVHWGIGGIDWVQ